MPAKTLKKQSKISSIFSKLNPTSPKKKLLLFVLVFGLMAGGYYAYRSFAAPGMMITEARNFTKGVPIYATVGGKRVVAEMGVTNGNGTNIWADITGTPRPTSSGKFRVCVNGRDSEDKVATVTVKMFLNKDAGGHAQPESKWVERTIKINSGWYDAGTFVNDSSYSNLRIIIGPASGEYDKTIRIRQVGIIKSSSSCPK